MAMGPAQHRAAAKLFAIVSANNLWQSACYVQFVEYPRQCTAAYRTLRNNANALVRHIVHNRQAFDRASVSTAIKHEIHRPNLIRLLRPYQWLTLTQRDLLALDLPGYFRTS
jgi:hypothetical protein